MTYREHKQRLRLYRSMLDGRGNKKTAVGIGGILYMVGFVLGMSEPVSGFEWLFPAPNIAGMMIIALSSYIMWRATQ